MSTTGRSTPIIEDIPNPTRSCRTSGQQYARGMVSRSPVYYNLLQVLLESQSMVSRISKVATAHDDLQLRRREKSQICQRRTHGKLNMIFDSEIKSLTHQQFQSTRLASL